MAKMAWIADEMSRQPVGTIWMVDKFGDVSFHPPIELSSPDEIDEIAPPRECDWCGYVECACDELNDAHENRMMMIEDGR